MPKSAKKAVLAPARKSKTLVNRPKPKPTPGAAGADMMVKGLGMNAVTARAYSRTFGELDFAECLAALIAEIRQVQSGNLGGPEATLTAQAITLNAMFTQLAFHSSKMTLVDHIDRFTRLALKAQGQCRATLETLAAIKNPPVVFARQANIAHGPQQVNNALTFSTPAAGAPAREKNQKTEQNELLEGHGARLDLGTTGSTSAGDQTLAAVGTLKRPTHT